jgi:hypothetical protein
MEEKAPVDLVDISCREWIKDLSSKYSTSIDTKYSFSG